jgi:hypothetical protein
LLPRYGLGRAELLPLRKGKEAISEYVGKYLEAGLIFRKHSWKGCRRVEFDRRAKFAWLACTRVFAWHSLGAKAWRKRVGELGAALGVDDMAGIRRKLGSKWAYRLRQFQRHHKVPSMLTVCLASNGRANTRPTKTVVYYI